MTALKQSPIDPHPGSNGIHKNGTLPGSDVTLKFSNHLDRPNQQISPYKSKDHQSIETPIKLSVGSKNTNKESDCHRLGKIVTYTPKDSYAFDSVHYKEIEIWKAHDRQYSNKIILKNKDKEEKFIFIFFKNQTYFVFHKTKDTLWRDLSRCRYSISKLKFYKFWNFTKVELTPDKYDPWSFKVCCGYKFRKGADCTEIRYDNKTIWTKKSKNPKIIYLNLETNQVFVRCFILDDERIEKTTMDAIPYCDPWLIKYESEGSTIYNNERLQIISNLQSKEVVEDLTIDLDIKLKRKSKTINYNRNEKSNIGIFTSHNGYKFKSVKYRKRELWKAKDESEYSKKVVVMHTKDKYICILLSGSKFVVLHRIKNIWNDETKERYSLDNFSFFCTYSNIKELEPTNYDLNMYNFSYGYKFNSESYCTEIKYGNETIWSYNNRYPVGIYLNLRTNKVFIKYPPGTNDEENLEMPKLTPTLELTTTSISKGKDSNSNNLTYLAINDKAYNIKRSISTDTTDVDINDDTGEKEIKT